MVDQAAPHLGSRGTDNHSSQSKLHFQLNYSMADIAQIDVRQSMGPSMADGWRTHDKKPAQR
jgi:hypothetical protein